MEEQNDIQGTPATAEPGERKDHFLGVSILVAAILISGSVIYTIGQKGTPRQEQQRAAVKPNITVADLKPTGQDVILGDPKAPVTLIEYGDYQCPFCGKMFQETEKKLREEYIKTNKVQMVYRDFPLDSIHPFARLAAEAANCAKDQGKFWLYHDTLFEKQSQIPSMDFGKIANELGLSEVVFQKCVTEGKYKDKVEQDLQGGIAIGVNSTPTTFVNGQALVGAQPYESFKAVIEKALKSK